jgi:hypothetical protein
MVESHSSEHDFMRDIMSGPTILMNLGERHVRIYYVSLILLYIRISMGSIIFHLLFSN